MERQITACAILTILSSLFYLPAMAGTIGYTSSVTATASLPAVSSSYGGNSFSAPSQTVSNTGINSTSASVDEFIKEYGGVFGPFGASGPFQASANASATVGFGYFTLDTYAAPEDWNDGPPGPVSSANATASAGFSDTMTIFGGTGTAALYWDYQESFDASNPSRASSQFTIDLPTQVTFGVPFDFSASGQIQNSGDLFIGFATAQAFFSINPVVFTVDGSSSLVYVTGSGTQYFEGDPNAIFAPEPSHVCMIAGILCVLIFARRLARS